MYHKVILAGHLGRNPEMRYLPDGTPVTSFSVATNERWTGKDGSVNEKTVWWRVSAWRRMAEVCNEYLSKGRPVLIEARMNADPESGGPKVFTRNDGTPGAAYEVTALTVKFLGRNGNSGEGSGEGQDVDENGIPF